MRACQLTITRLEPAGSMHNEYELGCDRSLIFMNYHDARMYWLRMHRVATVFIIGNAKLLRH